MLWLATLAVLAADGGSGFEVTFVIDMRTEVSRGRFDGGVDQVGVRGGVAPLTWERTVIAADADGDGQYEARVTFPRAPYGGQAVAYKYKVERPGAPGAGWEDGRNRQLVLAGPAQRVSRAFNSPPEDVTPARVGDIRLHRNVKSRFVGPRDVQVYLPPGYGKGSARYPVLYLHDGQNVFDGREAGMEWQVDEAAEAGITAGELQPFIVVAVDNTSARRDEYTPSSVEWTRPDGAVVKGGGKAKDYARFLVEELKPFIDRTYRTRPGAASTATGGASHGGLISLFLALEYPGVFGAALVMSPSAMWDDDLLIKRVAALPAKLPVRLWIDVGALEGPRMVGAAQRLRDAAVARGWTEGGDLHFLEQAEASHDELAWASRMPGALRFLWPVNR